MWRWAGSAGPTSTGMGPILKLPNKVSFLTVIGLVLIPINTRPLLLKVSVIITGVRPEDEQVLASELRYR